MRRLALPVLGAAALGGCGVSGHEAERDALRREGEPYAIAHSDRVLPSLGESATLPEVLRYAFLSNAGLERAYFGWASAVERVPQAAAWDDPRFAFEVLFSEEKMSRWDRTTLGAAQTIPFPGKRAAAGQAALEAAIAARRGFEDAKFALQADVVEAYTELHATDRARAVGRANLVLLREFVQISRDLVAAGRVRQADLLKAELEAEEADSDLRSLDARRTAGLARLNRLLSRSPAAALRPLLPAAPAPVPEDDAAIFALAAERNPDLAAMAAQVRGQAHVLESARLAWFPDLDLSFEIRGSVERMIGAMLALPFQVGRVRAGIREAQAGLRAAQAALRDRGDDLRARLVLQLYLARDAGRQGAVLRDSLLPKARQVVAAIREAYGAGAATFLELLDAQRALLALELEEVRMDVMHRQAVARLEALCALDFGTLPRNP